MSEAAQEGARCAGPEVMESQNGHNNPDGARAAAPPHAQLAYKTSMAPSTSSLCLRLVFETTDGGGLEELTAEQISAVTWNLESAWQSSQRAVRGERRRVQHAQTNRAGIAMALIAVLGPVGLIAAIAFWALNRLILPRFFAPMPLSRRAPPLRISSISLQSPLSIVAEVPWGVVAGTSGAALFAFVGKVEQVFNAPGRIRLERTRLQAEEQEQQARLWRAKAATQAARATLLESPAENLPVVLREGVVEAQADVRGPNQGE